MRVQNRDYSTLIRKLCQRQLFRLFRFQMKKMQCKGIPYKGFTSQLSALNLSLRSLGIGGFNLMRGLALILKLRHLGKYENASHQF